ncbi:MAG: SRPBCC family protein [Nocardioidaceae bacterium]
MTDDRPVSIEVTIAAPVATVWHWIRDRDRLGRWHGWLTEGLDEEIDYIYFDHATESDEPHALDLDNGDRFTLTEDAGATTVRITRLPPGHDPEWDAYYDDITEGWLTFLQQLRFAVEQHPTRPRRTVFLATEEAGPRPQDVLGLDRVRPGECYEPAEAAPSGLVGEAWFAAENQVGVTVDGLGPGLLVLGAQPPLDGRPDGGAMAILTTYDLDDERFAAVRDEWSTWWRATYPGASEPQT